MNVEITKPDAIMFDFDNTLVDSLPAVYKSYVNTLQSFGKDKITYNQFKALTHHSLNESFPNIFGQNWQEAAALYYNNYNSYSQNIKPFPGAESTLELVKKHNIPLAVISNKTKKILLQEIDKLNWQHFFDTIIGQKDTIQGKPSVAPVELALSNLKIDLYNSIWFIGDNLADMQCAHDSGCYSILFKQENLQYINKYKPKLVFDDYQELIDLVNNLL